jgi:hypothetical protein
MASTPRNGWLVAEPIVLLTGLFTVLVWLSIPYYSPIYALLLLSIFFPVIPSVAIVSFAIWIYRNKVSNVALFGSAALSCYSSLQFVFPIGPADGIFGIVGVLLLMMGSLYWLNASAERRRVVNN